MGIEQHSYGTSFTGVGIEIYRLLAWRRGAKLAQAGIKPKNLTLAAYRKQFQSKARTWVQAETELTVIIEAYKAQAGDQSEPA